MHWALWVLLGLYLMFGVFMSLFVLGREIESGELKEARPWVAVIYHLVLPFLWLPLTAIGLGIEDAKRKRKAQEKKEAFDQAKDRVTSKLNGVHHEP